MNRTKLIKWLLYSFGIVLFVVMNIVDLQSQSLEIIPNGNVGIGTPFPKSNLHVVTSGTTSSLQPDVIDRGIILTGTNQRSRIYLENTSSPSDNRVFVMKNENSGLSFGSLNNNATAWINYNILSMNSLGNVGIGTEPSDYKLNVNGSLFSTSASFSEDVGIGTVTPYNKLHVKKGASGATTSDANAIITLENNNTSTLQFLSPAANNNWLAFGDPQDKISGGIRYEHANQTLSFRTNGAFRMFIKNNGLVGIKTSSPQFPLDVRNYYNPGTESVRYFNYKDGLSTKSSGDYIGISAQWYVQAFGFRALSDGRLKRIKGISDSKSDLQILNKIEITDYSMRDFKEIAQPFKKVIAQQVQKVYSHAVAQSGSSEFIANVYQLAKEFSLEGRDLTVVLAKPIEEKDVKDVASGARIKIYLEERGNETNVKEMEGFVTNIEGKTVTITIEETVEINKFQQLFVFGTQVNDLLSVDYDAISMLNVSATQELAKQVETLKQENNKKNNEIIALRAQLNSQTQSLESLKTSVAQLQIVMKSEVPIQNELVLKE